MSHFRLEFRIESYIPCVQASQVSSCLIPPYIIKMILRKQNKSLVSRVSSKMGVLHTVLNK